MDISTLPTSRSCTIKVNGITQGYITCMNVVSRTTHKLFAKFREIRGEERCSVIVRKYAGGVQVYYLFYVRDSVTWSLLEC